MPGLKSTSLPQNAHPIMHGVPTYQPARVSLQVATPIPVHVIGNAPDVIAVDSLWISVSALVVSVVTLAAIAWQICLAYNGNLWAKRDYGISKKSLDLQKEAVKARPKYVLRVNGEDSCLEVQPNVQLDLDIFIVNEGTADGRPTIELGIPEKWQPTRFEDGNIKIDGLKRQTIPSFGNLKYYHYEMQATSNLRVTDDLHVGRLGKVFVPPGKWSLLWRARDTSESMPYCRVIVRSQAPAVKPAT